jgi:hypothetical protein
VPEVVAVAQIAITVEALEVEEVAMPRDCSLFFQDRSLSILLEQVVKEVIVMGGLVEMEVEHLFWGLVRTEALEVQGIAVLLALVVLLLTGLKT